MAECCCYILPRVLVSQYDVISVNKLSLELLSLIELVVHLLISHQTISIHSGGSRISRWGGANLRRVHFSAKTYAKMKEIDPVGGAHWWCPLDPPMIQSTINYIKHLSSKLFCSSKFSPKSKRVFQSYCQNT